jgi:hypothetical protein
MPIDEEKTCTMHTKEKEKSGTCCQIKDDEKDRAEQMTYEQSFLTKIVSVKNE